ncbi:Cdc6/Cdc18 family protein [Haloterrigena salifodinae]|uniref:Cdc6/Cdc18 family protein n=1 Tax=Haloterrigena salifodinae TaxID=2675099 RepID=UPI000F889482|nr:AAA family ATPase [Haloterrigena salifodinae]
MITKRWVFLDERLPEQVPHRHSECEQLTRALEPATRGQRGEDVLIYGPSGVGKTTTARHVLRREFRDYSIDWTLINSSNTRCAILHEAAIKHRVDAAVRPNSPADQLVDALESIVDQPYVVILDEAETVRDLKVLRDLYEIPLLSVIAIVHEPREWLARLDDELQNYFSLKSQIEFERYAVDELADILEHRAEHGLEPGVIHNEQLEWIADEVAGVARYGIQSLLSAAEFAEERDHSRIREHDIRDAFGRARTKIRETNLRSLPFGPCVIYELLRYADANLVDGARLHSLYETHGSAIYADRDHDPVSRRRVNDYLSKLVEYDLVRQHGENRWAEYEVIDENLEVPIQLELLANAS